MFSINRHDYPQLNQLMWDSQARNIDSKQAFLFYEKRWRYVEQTRLTQQEKRLIQRLITQFGQGLFLANR